MSTFLFDKVVFGPIFSRRLGVSLGINLLPINAKLCNFNCIYCECGWTTHSDPQKITIPTRAEVKCELTKYLTEKDNLHIDVVTFAGNGEPTIHPDFPGIIDDAWLEIVKQTLPKQVMIYTLARDTPISGLKKISVEVLNSIANRVKKLGIDVQISA